MLVAKRYFDVLYKVLGNTSGLISLQLGRKRDAILKLLQSEIKQLDADRDTILKTYCDKNDDGEPGRHNDDGTVTYSFSDPINRKDTEDELTKLFDETINIDIDNELFDTSLEVSTYQPETGETLLLDEFVNKYHEYDRADADKGADAEETNTQNTTG